MLERRHRFHGYRSLNAVYKNGQMARSTDFGLKVMLNPRRSDYRVAVVVSRKVNKSAVTRNRLRRRLYATMREFDRQINQPYDIVITVFKDSLLKQSPARLDKELDRLLRQSRVIG